jgi:hypothetical protein
MHPFACTPHHLSDVCKNPNQWRAALSGRAGRSGGRCNGGRLLAVRGRRQGLRRTAQSFVLGLRYPRARWLERDWLSGAYLQKSVSAALHFLSHLINAAWIFHALCIKVTYTAPHMQRIDTPAALKCEWDPPESFAAKIVSGSGECMLEIMSLSHFLRREADADCA